MLLTHVCPICGKNHEKDCTPEPDQPCDDCKSNSMKKKLVSDKREPAEQMREAQEILEEMRICSHCKDHMPCGCGGLGRMENGRPVEKGIDTV